MTHIAIVGGGIGGLTAAIGLRRAGIHPTVYEAADDFRPIGAGIWMPPNAMQVFRRLGIAREVEDIGMQVRRAEVRDWNGRLLTAVDLAPLRDRYGCGTVAIHRGRLHEVLADHVGTDAIELGRRCVGVEPKEDAPATIRFEDGSRALAEVVIGADGLHSVVRDAVAPQARVRSTGQVAVRGICAVPLPPSLEGVSTEYWGPGMRFGIVRLGPEQTYWWYAFDDDGTRGGAEPGASTAWVDRAARRFPSPVAEMVSGTAVEDRILTPLADLEPLGRWSRGTVVLLGDAAHAMTPNLGQGGAQAIEDAEVLAGVLGAEPASPVRAIRRYESLRRRRAHGLVRMSRWTGHLAHTRSRAARRVRDLALRLTPGWVEERQARWLYDAHGIREGGGR
jgi:2-polyprenyl-6-methoxyphenol hydroxylase-like FAD-dependent oxidoreductase